MNASLTNQFGIVFKGCGSFVPNQILTNNQISKRVDTNDKWIKVRTGISNRRISDIHENVAEMGFNAAAAAIKMANWDVNTIDLIVLASSTQNDMFGSAPSIQAKLGAKNAVAFDLTAACSGFLFALITTSQFLQMGSYKRAIVIGADQNSSFINWDDRRSCILFGDGAGAVAIEASTSEENLIGFKMKTDGLRGEFLNLKYNGQSEKIVDDISYRKVSSSCIDMNGKEVYKFAVREVPLILEELFQKTNFQSDDINWLLLHQANQRILDAVGERLKIDNQKILSNLSNYGNTSAATIPLMLDEAVRNNRISSNDIIAISGFGAGLSWGAALLRWG